MNIKPTLKKLGLNDKETAVYLASLESGDSTVSQIAKNTQIKRTTVYLVAQSLIDKGLLGQYKTRKGLHLAAEKPENLLGKIRQNEKDLEAIIPQLNALSKKEEYKPQVRYHEGKEAYFAIAEDTLQAHNSEVLWFGRAGDVYKVIGDKYDPEYYIPTRIKRKIRFRALLFKDKWTKGLKAKDSFVNLRQTKFLPDDFDFNASEFIYQDKIGLISSTKELMGVIIQSQDLAAMEKAKFEMLWGLGQ